MKYHIITFGCQMNISDSERIASILEQTKLEASPIEEADFIIINMCSVRQSAVDRVNGIFEKVRKSPASAKATARRSKTILTGCILKKDAKQFAKKFDYVLDIKDLPNWPKTLNLKQSHALDYGTDD